MTITNTNLETIDEIPVISARKGGSGGSTTKSGGGGGGRVVHHHHYYHAPPSSNYGFSSGMGPLFAGYARYKAKSRIGLDRGIHVKMRTGVNARKCGCIYDKFGARYDVDIGGNIVTTYRSNLKVSNCNTPKCKPVKIVNGKKWTLSETLREEKDKSDVMKKLEVSPLPPDLEALKVLLVQRATEGKFVAIDKASDPEVDGKDENDSIKAYTLTDDEFEQISKTNQKYFYNTHSQFKKYGIDPDTTYAFEVKGKTMYFTTDSTVYSEPTGGGGGGSSNAGMIVGIVLGSLAVLGVGYGFHRYRRIRRG